ncbi:hypothetical protein, partial [Streptococcus pseudopneumoniae]|uniref:hypothetical protein n=1 Tax=Streptococcus pseudopneumoniae TaxID=257758 RepID=UPI0014868DB6
MPDETQYSGFYTGKWVDVTLAKPEYILVSKALKAPDKNKQLIADYISSGPPEIFYELAEKYKVDLEKILG